jgi:hypothetical protein
MFAVLGAWVNVTARAVGAAQTLEVDPYGARIAQCIEGPRGARTCTHSKGPKARSAFAARSSNRRALE